MPSLRKGKKTAPRSKQPAKRKTPAKRKAPSKRKSGGAPKKPAVSTMFKTQLPLGLAGYIFSKATSCADPTRACAPKKKRTLCSCAQSEFFGYPVCSCRKVRRGK